MSAPVDQAAPMSLQSDWLISRLRTRNRVLEEQNRVLLEKSKVLEIENNRKRLRIAELERLVKTSGLCGDR